MLHSKTSKSLILACLTAMVIGKQASRSSDP